MKESRKIKTWRELVIENALDAVIAIDETDKIVDWNTQAELMYGWKKKSVIGQSLSELIIPPEKRAQHLKGLAKFLSTGIGPILNRRVELEAINSKGEKFFIELTVSPIIEDSKTLFYSFSRNISKKKAAEKEQQEQKNFLRAILMNAPTAICLRRGKDQRYEFVNKKYQELFNCQESDLLGKTLSEVSNSLCHDNLALAPDLSSVLAEGIISEVSSQPIAFYHNGVKKIRYFDLVNQPLTNDLNEVDGILSFLHEVTEITEAKTLAEEKESKLQTIIDTSPDLIAFLDLNLNYQFKNRKYNEILKPHESESSFVAMKLYCEKALLGEGTRMDFSLTRGKDSPITLDINFVPVIKDQTVRGVLVLAHDISERKLEEEDQKTLSDLSTFLAKNSDLNQGISHTLKTLSDRLGVNHCWLAEINPEQTACTVIQDIAVNVPSLDSSSELIQITPKLLDDWVTEWLTSISNIETDPRTKGSKEQFKKADIMSFLSIPLRREGKIAGLLGFSYPTETEWTRRDKKLAKSIGDLLWYVVENDRLLTELKRVIQSKDEFISICSHELKTPVTSLKLQYQIAQKQLTNPRSTEMSKEQINKIVKLSTNQLARISKLIDDMLDVSNISYGRLKIELAPLNLNLLLSDLTDRFKPQCELEKIPLTLELPNDSLWVNGDLYRIEQVVSNLINNAIKYGGHTPIKIILTAEQNGALISVSDLGRGIDEQHLEKIFNRYERGTETQETSGIGLGLYICRQIVKLHGGEIKVKSKINHGTTFTVQLPLLDDTASPGNSRASNNKNH